MKIELYIIIFRAFFFIFILLIESKMHLCFRKLKNYHLCSYYRGVLSGLDISLSCGFVGLFILNCF